MINVNINSYSVSSIAKQLYLGLAIDGKATMAFPNIAGSNRMIVIKFDMSLEKGYISIGQRKYQNPLIEAQAIAYINAFDDAETMPFVPVFCNGKTTKGIIGIFSSLHHLGVKNDNVRNIRIIILEVLRIFWAIHLDGLNIPQVMDDLYQDYPIHDLDGSDMVSQETYRKPLDVY
jgi:hypothetical protein|nr:MAG TPA: hypothetical protein [Caudoviricetes sp.]